MRLPGGRGSMETPSHCLLVRTVEVEWVYLIHRQLGPGHLAPSLVPRLVAKRLVMVVKALSSILRPTACGDKATPRYSY